MAGDLSIAPTVICIFGASGDLAQRKIVPALYDLFMNDLLPDLFCIIGLARTSLGDDGFRQQLRTGVDKFSRSGNSQDDKWEKFSDALRYIEVDYQDAKVYEALLREMQQGWQQSANIIFYLATPPVLFAPIIRQLGQGRTVCGQGKYRIVIEKPFGRDLQ